jgi:hypothetical protein
MMPRRMPPGGLRKGRSLFAKTHAGPSIRSGEGGARVTDGNEALHGEAGPDGWIREADGELRLWPMKSYSCRIVEGGIPAVRIDFLLPPGSAARIGKLQVHMTAQQARQFCDALKRALADVKE